MDVRKVWFEIIGLMEVLNLKQCLLILSDVIR